ncbi:hypothetical protein BJY01DRAFT_229789 [Aspergillus pseudoustus]|uniref:DUF4139 domain-containing protein n=1 Tax=Aspergillus pseudoustus TaxID=1810923 RepID=A0ABR4IF12_9EURO
MVLISIVHPSKRAENTIKMSEIATSEVLISDLPTKQVTLAPQQVTIVREIQTTIQSGQNEITLLGLDPRVNAHSIRIEGSGPATITDIQTSIVARDEDFNDVYPPDSDSESEKEEEDDETSEDEDGLNDSELQEIRRQMAAVEAQIASARSEINSALSVLGIMDTYGKSLSSEKSKDVGKFGQFLNLYTGRRGEEAERHQRAVAEIAIRERELARLQRKFHRRKARYAKEQKEAFKAIRLRKEKRDRALARKRALRDQKRAELRAFWTSTVGKVVVSLDSTQSLALTPGSSRRSSIVSGVVLERGDEDRKKQQEPIDVTLRLSYIVPGPSWFSRYELRINSPSSSARLTYRAEFNNSTAETWRDTRVTLSTSQASFSGIGVRIPYLDTWNIKLITTASKAPSWYRILDNPQSALGPVPPPFPKNALVGAPPPQVQAAQKGSLFAQKQAYNPYDNFGNVQAAAKNGFGQPAVDPLNSSSLIVHTDNAQSNNRGSSLFGNAAPAPRPAAATRAPAPPPPPPPTGGGLFGSSNNAGGFGGNARGFGNAVPPPPPPAARGGAQPNSVLAQTNAVWSRPFGSAPSGDGAQPGGGLFGGGPPSPSRRPRLHASIGGDDSLPAPPVPAAAAPPPEEDEGLPSPPAGGARSLFSRLTESITGAVADESEGSESGEEKISATVELEEDDDDESDRQTITSTTLEHQDSVKQDYGMTTTYELPGRRTLAPSHVARRHVLAELDLKSVALTYVIVPKRREAAFLRARIKNTSSLTLHPGQVGLTVDGSFVGTAGLETCAPGVFFNISLGIDPGIEVKYAKPVVKPLAGALFFNKEDGARFRRSVWVKNTKGVGVDLLVSDQIPVSEDEKLRVRVLEPAGLEKEGDEAPVKIEKAKGKGTVALRKNGEVKWTLRLEPGQEVRLVLEYEAKVPSGSDVSSV